MFGIVRWWMNDRQGIQAVSLHYVGFQEHTAGGKCAAVFRVLCSVNRSERVCPHTG